MEMRYPSRAIQKMPNADTPAQNAEPARKNSGMLNVSSHRCIQKKIGFGIWCMFWYSIHCTTLTYPGTKNGAEICFFGKRRQIGLISTLSKRYHQRKSTPDQAHSQCRVIETFSLTRGGTDSYGTKHGNWMATREAYFLFWNLKLQL